MRKMLVCLLAVFVLAGCGSASEGSEASESSKVSTTSSSDLEVEVDVPSCESIVEGVEIAEDFDGCMDKGTLYITLVYECDDGRELALLGDEGDPWRGYAYLPGTFLSWEVHGDEPLWNECWG